jgi:diguanylate cyclase (GGDEF)-like protein
LSAQADENTILIIDDNAETIQLLAAMVRDQGKVIFATDGLAGLEMARRQRPQLILLDVEMHHMDGFEVCRRIAADPDLSHSPVIFVTAHSSTESELAGLAAGAVDFITKPLIAPVVQARVRTHLRLQSALQSLQGQANRDGLTGLYNRRFFDERMAEEFARHQRQRDLMGVALIDVDHFKRYNDHYGHQMGDTCLKTVAHAIGSGTRRPAEIVARYGGEEFVVLLPNSDWAALEHYGAWICARVAALELPHAASPTVAHVSISVGLSAMLPEPGNAIELLLGQADRALYLAKQQGRNCYRVAAEGAGSHGS